MDRQILVNALNNKANGVFLGITYNGDLMSKVSASAKKNGVVSVTKTVNAVVRKGIDYSAQKSVKEKVADGKVLTHELPWGEWSTEPNEKDIIILHKGTAYARLYLAENTPKTKYYVNGKETAYTDLKDIMQASFFNKSGEKPDCITIKVDNITAIK